MPEYSVKCFARKVGAIGTHGTEQLFVRVIADNPEKARIKAIDECYRLYKNIEHVSPRAVVEKPQ